MSILWRPPQLRSEIAEDHRHATWTELFFDLIFVVCIAELTHTLLGHLEWATVGGYLLLFIPVWWSWAGGTFYSDRFDADDVSHRLIIALQMLFVAAMATTIHDAWHGGFTAFAVCYALVRTTVVFNYLRVGRHHPHARQFAFSYAGGFAMALLLWLAAGLAAAPWRYVLLALAVLADLGTPIAARRFNTIFPLHRSHLPERFGLFTIIVLGESVVSVVAGYTQGERDILAALVGAMGFVGIFAFWWVYFNSIEGSGLHQRYAARIVWIYSHLPLLAGLAAVAVGVRFAIEAAGGSLPGPERWLLCGSAALAYAMLGVQHLTAMGETCPVFLLRRAYVRFATAAGLCSIAVFAEKASTPVLGLLIVMLGAFNVLYDLASQAQWNRELERIRQAEPPAGSTDEASTGLELESV